MLTLSTRLLNSYGKTSNCSVTFLDINISVQDNNLATSVPVHSYLLHSSSHTFHVKDSIPYSQFLRLRRLCSDDSDLISFPSAAILITSYPAKIVSKTSIENPLWNHQPQTMKNEFLSHLLSTLSNLAARNVVLRNFKILQSDPETAPIFPYSATGPVHDRNLQNSLIRSSLPSNLEPGTFNYSRKRCNTCPSINSKTHVKGPKVSYQVNDHLTFQLHNLKISFIASLYSLKQTIL